MKFEIISVILLLLIQISNAQNEECLGILDQEDEFLTISTYNCSGSSTAYLDIYRHQSSYVPDDYTSVKVLRVNMHIIQDDDPNDRKNFQNISSHVHYIQDLISEVNNYYRDVALPTDPVSIVCGDCYIPDSKIQFELMGIYFHIDGATYDDLANGKSLFDVGRTAYTTYGSNKSSEVNLIMIGDENLVVGSYTNLLPSFNFSNNQYICTSDYFYYYEENYGSLANTGKNLAHELGHVLGLLHTYEPTCCPETCSDTDIDYLEDVFGINPPSNCWFDRYCHAADPDVPNCTNNLMGASWNQFGYISPLQQARMQRNLSIKSTRKYVKEESYSSVYKTITSDEVWDFDIRLYNNIKITNGASLELDCNLKVPEKCKIEIEEDSKLILSGTISCASSIKSFNGIVVSSGAYLELNNTAVDFSIKVESGGTLRIVDNLIVSGNSIIEIESGGYICIDNSASLTLQDILSILILKPGYISGVNTSVVSDPGTCILNPSTISFSGDGSVLSSFTQDTYVQNLNVTSDAIISGKNIYVGYSVTPTLPYGNVVIKDGASVIFVATEDVVLQGGFSVELGGFFEMK